MFVISCNGFREVLHLIFKWKWNTELEEEVGRKLPGNFAGSGTACIPASCAAPLPSHALQWDHQFLLGRAQQLEDMDTQVQYWYFCSIFTSRGFGFWFIFLVPFLSSFSVSYLQIHALWWPLFFDVHLLPSFLFLPLSLPFSFSVQAVCDCNQVLPTMIRLNHATAPHVSPIYCKS